jgi:predicted house-cleaning noncanonical NTP pyrophosphatase (MazG superfamily)
MPPKRRFKVDKLIRDLLPGIMEQEGTVFLTRVMGQEEYMSRLKDKLLEEVQEIRQARCQKEVRGELADLLEVMLALGASYDLTLEDVIQAARDKKRAKGGFEGRIYNPWVEMEADSPAIASYLAQPDKYPEESL